MIKFTKKLILQALDRTLMPTVILDAQKPGFPVVYINPAVEILLGRDSDELVGMAFTDILAEGYLPETINESDPAQIEGCTDRHRWHTRDGVSVKLNVRLSFLQDRHGQPVFLMLSVVEEMVPSVESQSQDAVDLRSELVDARCQIKSLQRTDSVTGLAKRSAFEEVLERDWAIARREQRRIGVIVFSVDCLAEYREIFGRHATDSMIRKVGHAIGGTLRRAGDMGARIANDRFAALIGDAGEDQAVACANRIASKVRNLAIHHPRSTTARFATVSFGVASEVPAWTKNSVNLLEDAEHQLESGGQAVEERRVDRVAHSDDEEFVTED